MTVVGCRSVLRLATAADQAALSTQWSHTHIQLDSYLLPHYDINTYSVDGTLRLTCDTRLFVVFVTLGPLHCA